VIAQVDEQRTTETSRALFANHRRRPVGIFGYKALESRRLSLAVISLAVYAIVDGIAI
jgi:hypothetical protein